MNPYFVEGLFVSRRSHKKASQTIEPYAQVVWADSPAEAIRIATQELAGGQWVEGPIVGRTSEEQRMRQVGAPELPGFGTSAPKVPKRVSKKLRGLLGLLIVLSSLAAWGAARPVAARLVVHQPGDSPGSHPT